jgi:hypothetical protein
VIDNHLNLKLEKELMCVVLHINLGLRSKGPRLGDLREKNPKYCDRASKIKPNTRYTESTSSPFHSGSVQHTPEKTISIKPTFAELVGLRSTLCII